MKITINRRQLLRYIVAGTAGSSVFPYTASATSKSLHLEVAEQIKSLFPDHADSLRILIPNGSSANVTPVTTHFTRLTGIKITTEEAPVDDINTQLILNYLSGNANYDVALPATFGLPDLVAAGAILPLTKYAEKYEPNDFRSAILFGVGDSFDDDIYGFQADGDAYIMFYHRTLLEDEQEKNLYEDKFGMPLTIPDTWSELDQQMEFFHRPHKNVYGGLLFRTPGYLAWEWWVRFHAKGLWPLSKNLVPQINSDEGVIALEELIRATEFLAPNVRKLGLFDNWERYGQGDIYCNIGWGGTQKYLNGPDSNMKGKMAYGTTPGGIVDNKLLKTPYFNWGWNYVVTTDALYPELAYLFSLFASTAEMSRISVQQQAGYFDPIQQEHYEDPEIERIYTREFLNVHEQSLKTAIPDLYLANQGEYFNSLSVALDKALDGKLAPDVALDRAAQEWHLINKRSDMTAQTDRWRELREKYPTMIRGRLRDLI